MSGLGEAAKRVFSGKGNDVSSKLDGLGAAVEASRGRIDDEILAPAEMLVGRASDRLRMSGEHTIVALAGATGSGKSSLFNALTDLDLAGVGVRRPTTSWALACAWGPDGAGELLEWMGIPPRHQVSRMSMLDRERDDDTNLQGLVLLDLPDHDSTEVSHHLEMDRLVQHADLMIWVLDPQKYADAALHERYIRPMASYSDVTMVVLNQIDRINYDQRPQALNDVKRILAVEGLPDVTVLGVSATRGDGIEDLKRELVKRIRAKSSAKGRLTADIKASADVIAQVGGTSQIPGISDADELALDDALVACAGVPQVVSAISTSTRRRAALMTGWPLTRWVGRLRKDPLKKLGLGSDMTPSALARSVVPEPTHVQRAQAEIAIREFADKAAVGLERPWRESVRDASTSDSDGILDALDKAMVTTDLGVAKPALWWRLVNVLQWLTMLSLTAGLGWLALLGVVKYSSLTMPDPPEVAGFSLPVLLSVGAVLLGLALAVLSRLAARLSGRRKSRRADRQLRSAIAEVIHERVVAPMQAELDAYEQYRVGIDAARN